MSERVKKILLVEDEPHLAFNLEYNLKEEGYAVVYAATGHIALEKWRREGPFDLVVLDIMLPEIDGMSLARQFRSESQKTGLLMLTARATEADVVLGLEAGADDYMTKPFHLKEFLLRVKRMAERSALFPIEKKPTPSRNLRLGSIELNMEEWQLSTPKGHFKLTELEALLLREFMENPNKVLSRDHLLQKVWGIGQNVETRTVDNFIMRLRRYLEPNPSQPRQIESVRGRGYKLISQQEE